MLSWTNKTRERYILTRHHSGNIIHKHTYTRVGTLSSTSTSYWLLEPKIGHADLKLDLFMTISRPHLCTVEDTMCATFLWLVVDFSSSSITCLNFPKISHVPLLHLPDRFGDLGKKLTLQKPRRQVFRPLNFQNAHVLHHFTIGKLSLYFLYILALRGCTSSMSILVDSFQLHIISPISYIRLCTVALP